MYKKKYSIYINNIKKKNLTKSFSEGEFIDKINVFTMCYKDGLTL